jgi:hypothetical protein
MVAVRGGRKEEIPECANVDATTVKPFGMGGAYGMQITVIVRDVARMTSNAGGKTLSTYWIEENLRSMV